MEDADDHESNYSESSEEAPVVDGNIHEDMEKLANTYPSFKQRYRLIKRIGEGSSPPIPMARLVPLTQTRYFLHRLQSRRPAVRAIRQLLGHGEREREMVAPATEELR